MSRAKLQEAIEGERFRIEQSAERLRTLLDSALVETLKQSKRGTPQGAETGHAIAQCAGHILASLAKLDGYQRAMDEYKDVVTEERERISKAIMFGESDGPRSMFHRDFVLSVVKGEIGVYTMKPDVHFFSTDDIKKPTFVRRHGSGPLPVEEFTLEVKGEPERTGGRVKAKPGVKPKGR